MADEHTAQSEFKKLFTHGTQRRSVSEHVRVNSMHPGSVIRDKIGIDQRMKLFSDPAGPEPHRRHLHDLTVLAGKTSCLQIDYHKLHFPGMKVKHLVHEAVL